MNIEGGAGFGLTPRVGQGHEFTVILSMKPCPL